MAGKYRRICAPESVDALSSFPHRAQRNFEQAGNGKGATVVSIKPDNSFDDGRVFSMKIKGHPTAGQDAVIASYAMS